MGLTDVLFGRKRLKGAARDRLFALSTASVTLQLEGLKPGGAAGVVFKPLSAAEFVRAENELQELLDKVDPDLEDLVATVHLIGSELQSRGFGDRLLAAIFKFDGKDRPVYWVYGYKRGAWWPFVPTGKDKERDNAEELELKAKLEGELPIEQDLSAWFGLFDAPL